MATTQASKQIKEISSKFNSLGEQAMSDRDLMTIILKWYGASIAAEISRLWCEAGSLAKIDDADIIAIEGSGKGLLDMIHALAAIVTREVNKISEIHKAPEVHSPSDAASLVRYEMSTLDREEIWIMIMDVRNRVRKIQRLYKGTQNSVTSIKFSEIFREAIRMGLSNIIIFHNHPSGDPSPSPEDIALTRQLVSAANIMDMTLMDHIVIGNGRYYSIKEGLPSTFSR